MAAESINSLRLLLVYGQRKEDFDLNLPTDEAGGVLQVRHLAKKVEEITGVPVESQRLIFKGKSLTDQNTLLIPDGIRNGSKIMLIGKKPNPEQSEALQKLKLVEQDLVKEETKLSDVTSDLDGIHRGFLQKDLQLPALEQLGKHLSASAENFMKLLEKMDGLEMDEKSTEARAKRKSVVERIQTLLVRCDGLSQGVQDLILRCSS